MKNSKSIIIVESPNDRFFVEALVRAMQTDVENTLALEIIAYDDLQDFVGDDGKIYRGLSETSIAQKIKQIILDIDKYPRLENIGILIDQDNDTTEKRLELVSNAVKIAFGSTANITALNQFFAYSTKEIPLNIACYFNGIDGKGELETVLKVIASSDATYANCLEAWNECIKNKEKTPLAAKEFDKFWIDIYKRFDTLDKKQRNQKNTDWGNIFDKNSAEKLDKNVRNANQMFDFEHEKLTLLKTFLRLFL
jgi:hypothetical protein